jgi:hypothetical protein
MFNATSQPETLPGKRDNVSPYEQNKIICFDATFKAAHITEQPNNMLMGRQYLFVDISNCEHYRKIEYTLKCSDTAR